MEFRARVPSLSEEQNSISARELVENQLIEMNDADAEYLPNLENSTRMVNHHRQLNRPNSAVS